VEHKKHRVQKGYMCINLILKSEVGKIRDFAMHKYLFRTKLRPVMHYKCMLWGFRESEELERMQRIILREFFGSINLLTTSFNCTRPGLQK